MQLLASEVSADYYNSIAIILHISGEPFTNGGPTIGKRFTRYVQYKHTASTRTTNTLQYHLHILCLLHHVQHRPSYYLIQ